MTHADAAKLAKGATVISKHSTPAYAPLRVTEVKVAGMTGTRFAVRVASLVKGTDSWLDPSAIEHPPAGALWDTFRRAWFVAVPDAKAKGGKVPGETPATLPKFATFDDLADDLSDHRVHEG